MIAITLGQGNVDSLSIRSNVFPKLHCNLKISWTWIQVDAFQSDSKEITLIKCCCVISRILLGKSWYREADFLLVQSADECIGEDAHEAQDCDKGNKAACDSLIIGLFVIAVGRNLGEQVYVAN